MTVNKELTIKLIQYMDETTDRWFRRGRRDKLSVGVDPDARFSFYKYAAEFNLLEDSKERLDDISIPCPFHVDDSPSCNLNDKLHKYHCFSCDRGGNIINFLVEYDREILGINSTYYQKINELLQNDKDMQAAIGADTIYGFEDVFSLEDGLKRFKPTLHKEDVPKSYPELASLMLKHKCSIEQIKYFILLMQAGESVSNIYKEIFQADIPQQSTNSSYDLQSLLLFDE